MAPRPPISVGIQPQMALYSVILGGACAYAAYSEKYRRNEDDIDDTLKKQYYANMMDAKAKIPQMTNTIRGEDVRLDGTMNKLVWGGKAKMVPAVPKSNGRTVASDTGSSSSEEEGDYAADMTEAERKRVRRRKRKEAKRKKLEQQKKLEEEKVTSVASRKLVAQSMVAGAALGAVAVAASVFVGGSRRN